MQLSSLLNIITIALASGVVAVPVPESSPSDASILQARQVHECRDVTYFNQYDNILYGNALIDDCQKLAESIDANMSRSAIGYSVKYGTCEFWSGIPWAIWAPWSWGWTYPTKIGGQDAKDIITNAIRRFGRDGRVSASGSMKCNQLSGETGWPATAVWHLARANN
ncbi:hypothetical protein VTJ04DRAFT_10012 [Mycothermus thermophilus]|uniref:uncharacterized protein n=1 Tax=Humicola insolens TaxID=85995 RepID=UPI0037432D4F